MTAAGEAAGSGHVARKVRCRAGQYAKLSVVDDGIGEIAGEWSVDGDQAVVGDPAAGGEPAALQRQLRTELDRGGVGDVDVAIDQHERVAEEPVNPDRQVVTGEIERATVKLQRRADGQRGDREASSIENQRRG